MSAVKASADKLIKTMSAVDLITVVVFAALFRILFMIYKLAEIIFPWNHPAWYFFCMLCLAPALVIVRKIGTATIFTLTWLAINFFFQGEIPLWWICLITVPLIPELYLYLIAKKDGLKPTFDSFKVQMVAGLIYTALAYVSNMLLIIYALQNPMPKVLFWPVGVLALIAGALGIWAGFGIGKKIQGLIG
jgi:hypothetical protein